MQVYRIYRAPLALNLISNDNIQFMLLLLAATRLTSRPLKYVKQNPFTQKIIATKKRGKEKKSRKPNNSASQSASLYYLILINVAPALCTTMYYHKQLSSFSRLSFGMNAPPKIPNRNVANRSKRSTAVTDQTDSHNTIDPVNRRMKEIALPVRNVYSYVPF